MKAVPVDTWPRRLRDVLLVTLGTVAPLVAVSACSGAGTTGADPQTAESMMGVTSDKVKVGLRAPAPVRTGGDLSVTVTITNPTTSPVEVTLTGRPERPYIGVTILNSAGDTVATLANTTVVLRSANTRMIAPGQTIDLTATISLPGAQQRIVPPGDYLISAQVLAVPSTLRTSTQTLTVTP